MKTERRHELQQNELADLLGVWISRIRPYWRAMVGTAILIAAVVVAVRVLYARREATAARAWNAYLAAAASQDAEQLLKVAEQYPSANAGLWALQSVADIRLADGSRLLFFDRQQAEEELKAAAEAYEQVRENASDDSLKQRATFGLGQVREAQNNLDDAKKIFQQVVQTWPDSPLAESARERLAMIDDKSTQTFYTWFYSQEVKPPADKPSLSDSQWPDLPDLSDLTPPPTPLPPGKAAATDGVPAQGPASGPAHSTGPAPSTNTPSPGETAPGQPETEGDSATGAPESSQQDAQAPGESPEGEPEDTEPSVAPASGAAAAELQLLAPSGDVDGATAPDQQSAQDESADDEPADEPSQPQ